MAGFRTVREGVKNIYSLRDCPYSSELPPPRTAKPRVFGHRKKNSLSNFDKDPVWIKRTILIKIPWQVFSSVDDFNLLTQIFAQINKKKNPSKYIFFRFRTFFISKNYFGCGQGVDPPPIYGHVRNYQVFFTPFPKQAF